MISKSHDKSRSALTLIVKSVSALILVPLLVVSANVDTAAHRTRKNFNSDPCTFTALLEDESVLEKGYEAIRTMLLQEIKKIKVSLLQLHQQDPGIYNTTRKAYRPQLQIDANYLLKMLEDHAAALISPCQQQNKHQCRVQKSKPRKEIKKICKKLRWVKMQIKRLKEKDFERQNSMGELELADKYSFQLNTTKLSVPAKPGSFKWIHARKAESTKSSSRIKRAAIANRNKLWDYGVIPYVIDDIFSDGNRALFKAVMRYWERYTCIIFKEKVPEDDDYILITIKPCGCCSYVGKSGGGVAQVVSLGTGCHYFGIVLHELGHVIGFWHEHSRPDRDHHVEILYTNIQPDQLHNFNKISIDEVNSLGEVYDFESIMHYSTNSFAHSYLLDTILPRGTINSSEIGQRTRLSHGDIKQTNKLYSCPECGRTLQKSTDTFYHRSSPGVADSCEWRLSATPGNTIALSITSLNIAVSHLCAHDYLEVRDGHYFESPLLGRYCGNQLPDTLISTGTRMWVKYTTQNGGYNGFAASYKAFCGGEFFEAGTIASPSYPDEYHPKQKCFWRIIVKKGLTVVLRFQFFQLENHITCEYDYVAVYDGPTEKSPLLGKYCGHEKPGTIESSGNTLFLKFVSDEINQKAGFSATFVQE